MLTPARIPALAGLFCILLFLVATTRTAGAVEKAPVAIKGYDPVAYFVLGKAIRGRADLEYEWDEQRYRFAQAKHLDMFRADPVRYAPQFPNFCAMSLARGEVVEANPENWLIAGGKLYMFGKTIGPALFRENLAQNIANANGNRELIHHAKP